MSTTRINELPAAASVNSGDFLAIDNTSGVSQKITAGQLVNVDPTLSAAGRPADAKATGDAISAETSAREQAISEEAAAREAVGTEVENLRSALNIINPPLDITWTLGIGISSSGVEYGNRYTAATNAIYAMPGDVFATDSPTTDSNGKFLVYYVCEYAGSVFKKRTEFSSSVRSVVIGADTDNIRVVFGRYGSSDITITQADIDTYLSIEFTQKAGAASLVKAIADKVNNLDTDTFIINRYAYQGNDVNDIAENTFYFCAEGTINNPSTQGGYFIQTILYRSDAAAAMQIAYRFDNGLIYYRRKVTGTWRSWLCVSSHSIPSDPLYYAFGDSLTYGAVWTPKEEAPYYQITQASVTNQIPTRIANAIGAAGNYQNKGVGGAYFVGTGNNKIITAIQNTNLTNAKIITVAGGRNDSENPLGDKNSTVGDGTICGAIKEILEYLTTTYKQLQIVWIGVTPNTRDNSTVFTRVFAGGWSLNTFDEKVSELCAEYGVPYVNWKECTYIRHWADFSGAGDVYSHPNNENSYLQMGNYIAGKVSAFYKG